MTRGILFLPVAAVSLNSCSAFLVSTSSCRLKKPASTLRSTSFSCHANELVQRRPCQRRARSYSVSMMAKKKKGPAADALASLETLEALEVETEPAVTVEERPSLPVKKAKKKKGAKAKGPAADALAALEELEAKGEPGFGSDVYRIHKMSNSALHRYSMCYCEKPCCALGCMTYGRHGRCCVAFQQSLNSPPLLAPRHGITPGAG